jgi:hypothetical protein
MEISLTGKAGWLARIEREQAAWEAIVAEATPAGMQRPGAAGDDWSFVDVAGHLNGWRTRTVDRLEAAARGQEPPPPPWPVGLREEDDDELEAINRHFLEQTRQRSAPEILAEAREQFQRMRTAVAAIPEADLITPGRYSWLGDDPLSAVLAGSFEHVHEEHEPAIRDWLSKA